MRAHTPIPPPAESAAGIVEQAANPEANIIFGATSSDEFEDEMRVTVIATGFEQKEEPAKSGPATSAAKVNDSTDVDAIFNLFRR